MHKWLIFIMFFSLNSFAQDYPEHLVSIAEKGREYFEVYGQKSPSEIEDGIYDDSESLLFYHVDQINGLHIIFNKEEIRKLKAQMVKLIAESFTRAQLEAIIRVVRSPDVNKKISAKYFEVALEYKTGKIVDVAIHFLLSPKLRTMR